MEVALFARVSTQAQDAQNQIAEIERLAAARGWTITHRYSETISGASQRRPELERMLADAHAGRFKLLIVWALDRLGRRGIAETAAIVQKLDRAGVSLVSVREPWADGTGPVRDLLVAVMAWVAAQERERLRERLAAARQRLQREGRSWGRPRRLSDEQVAAARPLQADGKSQREIAVALKIPRSTIRHALNRTA